MSDLRLLVIDDDPAFGRFVKRVAEPLGFEVAAPENGGAAAMAVAWRPLMILLDLHMPGQDGIEMLRRLATDRCTARIVVTSGSVDGRTLEIATKLGAERGLDMVAPLRKPLRPEALRSLLEAARLSAAGISAEELAEAIGGGQLFLEYQPKLDCRLGRITAVEALVRWRHPRLGTIPPDRFIPLAEGADLIEPLTAWVTQAALDAAVDWQRRDMPLEIAVNVSGKDLHDIELPDRMETLCARRGIPPDRLVLEITETHAMGDAVNAMDVLTRLRIKGFKLSIDDFGTGYSSLVQLHRLPFSELKIDRTFVAGLPADKESRDITEIIILLSHKLGMKCVAEGVETKEALDVLKEMGCDALQGYYVGRPIPADEIVEFVGTYGVATSCLQY